MKLIVGLGNPGRKYEKTRHNCGYMVMDLLADKCNCEISQEKFKALIGTFKQNGETVVLMKPLTYMNESGQAVREAVDFYKIPVEDILIIHDDLDLPVGKIRVRTGGSSGGQKGMASIISHLNTQEINRIRIGIDKDPQILVVDYVLGKAPNTTEFKNAIAKASDAAYDFISTPISDVMNQYNRHE